MPEQKMIPCPYCKGTMFTPIDGMDSRLPCIHCDDGTIPDRRAPSAAEDALRAEVEALKKELDTAHKTIVEYIEEDNAGYLAATAEVEQLKAALTDEGHTPTNMQMWAARALRAEDMVVRLQTELEKYTQPLTKDQACDVASSYGLLGYSPTCVERFDAAIRAAREGAGK